MPVNLFSVRMIIKETKDVLATVASVLKGRSANVHIPNSIKTYQV
jgi:hypothetical protein